MRKTTVGLIIGNLNPEFENDIAQGVNKYAQEHKINVIALVPNISAEDKMSDRIFDSYKSMGIDGLMVLYGSLQSMKTTIIPEKVLNRFNDVPYVIIQDIYNMMGKSNIIVNNRVGMSSSIEHLINEHHYKNILYMSGPKDNYDSIERLEAYKSTMEKHGLNVTEEMIEYGDFSYDIEKQLLNLIKNNKEIDAIQFANDIMAIASYPILEKLGYKIGKDIAITGFDNIYKSSIVHPALTTVSQEPIRIGYEAMREIDELIKGKKGEFIKLDTSLITRKSCGCRRELTTPIDFEELAEEEIIDHFINERSINSKTNINLKELKRISTNVLKRIKGEYTADEIVYYIKNAIINIENPITSNYEDIFSYLTSAMKKYLDMITDYSLKEKVSSILFNIEKWYFSYVTSSIVSENQSSLAKVTNVSLVSRKMLNDQLSKSEMFEKVFNELKKIGVNSAYIYLYDNDLSNHVYLTAYYNQLETKIFNSNNRNERRTVDNFFYTTSGSFFYGFSLSSSEKYYGFIVCEADVNLINLVELVCAQIGTLMYIDEIRKNEKKSQIELKKTLRVIQEKNEILNNLSLYDELTHIYNRRGFIEKSLELLNESEDEKIELVFCDLDHLKEINDSFGHKEGDFAITTAAKLLKKAFPKDAILSRIGGDEFVAIYKLRGDFDVINKVKNIFNKFNEICKKPYYIETSIGYTDIIATDEIKISELINTADKYLYESKKNRRTTIKK